MLHGQESLKRLIGKRRRRIRSPNVAHLLRSPPQSPPADFANEGDSGSGSGKGGGGGSDEKEMDTVAPAKERGEIYDKEWVSCPVCGSSIRGTDHIVNSHLDSCLSRGTKRKLTQCTLLQFQFSRKSTTKSLHDINYNKEDSEDTVSVSESGPNIPLSLVACVRESNVGRHCLDQSPRSSETCPGLPAENIVITDTVSHKIVDSNCFSSPQLAKSLKMEDCQSSAASSVLKFDACVVGRKFHEDVELRQGASISLVRDPQNAKDKHAIKVIYADSECEEVLGYLPRDLSKYLSPLMDNHFTKCEGFISSLPKHAVDSVPIQLVCRRTITFDDLGSVQLNFLHLWDDLLRAIESGKANTPSMSKYQKNFHLMIEDVMNHHTHLFTIQEQSFIGCLNTLSDEGQRLFIRLFTRKGPWFQVKSISYSDVQDSEKAIKELQCYVNIFDTSEEYFRHDMKEVLDMLNVSQLREILLLGLSERRINYLRRHEIIDVLFSAHENGKCSLLPELVLQQAGPCVRISSTADILFSRIQRLFFLNGEQDLSAFFLVDLGVIKFPEYITNVSSQIFHNRNDFLAYEEAIEVAQIMDDSLDENNFEMVIRCISVSSSHLANNFRKESQPSDSHSRPRFFSCFSAAWVYSKVLSLGVSFFEREHRYRDAIRLLKGLLKRISHDSRRGYWTLRLSVNFEHIGQLNESLSVAEEGVLDPWVRAGSRMALQRRVLRLGKPPRRWKTPPYADSVNRKIKEVHIMGRPLTCEVGAKNLFYGYDGELCGVEQLALQYYAEEGGGWQGVHSESGIWMTIFSLIMWDVIFSNIPNVFISRFQVAPLDLQTDDFYEARRNLVESQLQKINDGMADEILSTSWESHFGFSCRGINWERHSLSVLRAAVSCIRGHCLASLCRHLAQDYDSWSSGMPDLLLWRFNGDYGEGEAKLVEVKGPRDRLSEQQRAWMLILMDCGFDTEVCKVNLISKSQ